MRRLLSFTDEIALFIRVGRSWQLYRLSHLLIRCHRMLTVESKLPSTAEVHALRLCLCLHRQTEGSH